MAEKKIIAGNENEPGTQSKARAGCPNASGWYRRLCELISPLLLLNCDQLWQLFSRGWTILLSTIIHDLDSRITAKYSKCQTSFCSMQVSFRFHSGSEMLWDTCISEYLHKDSNLEVSLNREGFEKKFRKLTHHPYLDGHLGQSGTRYRPQFYKVGLLPSPRRLGAERTVISIHLCTFRLYSAYKLCGFQTKKKGKE